MRRSFAFTLIELLIVVAIIAILAAIAIPNLLEAQVRSKVSRARADMRAIATALEAYFTDHGDFPPNPDVTVGFNVTPIQLTTPIAFLSVRPIDPFKRGRDFTSLNPVAAEEGLFYDYYKIIEPAEFIKLAGQNRETFVLAVDASGPLASLTNRGALQKYGQWLMWSVGPDGEFWKAEDDFANALDPSRGLGEPMHPPWGYSFDVPYDPSNGSSSFGNIIISQKNIIGTKAYEPPR